MQKNSKKRPAQIQWDVSSDPNSRGSLRISQKHIQIGLLTSPFYFGLPSHFVLAKQWQTSTSRPLARQEWDYSGGSVPDFHGIPLTSEYEKEQK